MSDLGNKDIMSENIQRLMDEKGITRNKLCDDLDLKYSTVRDWIKGKTYPRIDKIEKMANYFHVEKSDLVEKYNPNKNKAFDLKKAIDNDELMSYGGKEISPLEKEMVKRILEERDND